MLRVRGGPHVRRPFGSREVLGPGGGGLKNTVFGDGM